MKAKVRKQLQQRKRKLRQRISVEHGTWQSPMKKKNADSVFVKKKRKT